MSIVMIEKNYFKEEVNALVHEVAAVYKSELKNIDISYRDFLNNKLLIVHSIRNGISYSFYNKIKELSPFTELDWANFLGVSTKTMQRFKNEKKHLFKPQHSEKIIELAEVTNYGNEVFDSKNKFYEWLKLPSIALGSMTPLELLMDSYGKEMVMEELSRIDQGIFV
jgi:putative toxin-antitoxin system antitoxin component (TIGR02293 family)